MTTENRVFAKLSQATSQVNVKLARVSDIIGGQSQLNERFVNALQKNHEQAVSFLDNLQAAMQTLEDDAHDLLVETKEVYDQFKELGHEGGMRDMEQYTEMLLNQKRKCKAMAEAAVKAIDIINPSKVFK